MSRILCTEYRANATVLGQLRTKIRCPQKLSSHPLLFFHIYRSSGIDNMIIKINERRRGRCSYLVGRSSNMSLIGHNMHKATQDGESCSTVLYLEEDWSSLSRANLNNRTLCAERAHSCAVI